MEINLKKDLLAFFKKAHRTNALHSAHLGDDLLIGDGACFFRIPFPGSARFATPRRITVRRSG